jgi:dolichol-phosphate mannosyltransferase
MKILFVLPAFNEAESLPHLLSRFSALPDEARSELSVCVVDDGSSDETGEIARNAADGLSVSVVTHEVNRGLGQAVQTGIRHAVANLGPDDVMVLMDADDTHDPELGLRLAEAVDNGADIAIASRFVTGGDDATAPFFRRLLSRGAAICFRFVLPIDHRVNDFTSGFRAYRVSLLERGVKHWGERLVEERGFACMVELLLKLRHCNPKIVELPLFLEYDRKRSVSKIRIFRTILQYLKLAIRDRVSPPPFLDI